MLLSRLSSTGFWGVLFLLVWFRFFKQALALWSYQMNTALRRQSPVTSLPEHRGV